MLKLRIIGDPKAVQKALGTNIPYYAGQMLYSADEFTMRKFASDHPDLVEPVEEIKAASVQAPEPQADKAAPRPKKNKMLRKGAFFKSK
jgi:hypothetical protein